MKTGRILLITLIISVSFIFFGACTRETPSDGDGDGDSDGDSDGDGDGDGDGDCPEDAECCSDLECTDNIYCNGVEVCDRGRCEPDPDAVMDPTTGQFRIYCDDGIDCTDDMCDEMSNVCVHIPVHERCVDESICDGVERCVPGLAEADENGCVEGTPYVCDDENSCTDDFCDDTGSVDRCSCEDGDTECPASEDCDGRPCVHGLCVCFVQIRDRDGDGHGDRECTLCDEDGCERGTDCNDANPEVYPDAPEICDDGEDNNCDRIRDYADPDCDVPNDSCDTAMVLWPGETVISSTRGTRSDVDSGCSSSSDDDVVFAFTLIEEQDVEITVESITSRRVTLALSADCGNDDADLLCTTGRTFTQVSRGLLPGTYYAVVSSAGDADFSIVYNTFENVPTPDGDICSSAEEITTDGTATSVSTVGAHHDIELSCADSEDGLLDMVYEFSLNTEQTADFTVDSLGGTGIVAMAVQERCGITPTELVCWEDVGEATGRVWRMLPGDYTLVVAYQEEAALQVSIELNPLDPGLYIIEDFSSEPSGWELAGCWEQGTPAGGSDPEPDAGGCIGTNIGGTYPIGITFSSDYAQTPAIDLRGAVSPELRFRSWLQTNTWESGGALQIATSSDGPWSAFSSSDVDPAYDGMPYDATSYVWWGSRTSWSDFTADLSDYIDEVVYIRFGLHSYSWEYTPLQGWYIDSVMVVER